MVNQLKFSLKKLWFMLNHRAWIYPSVDIHHWYPRTDLRADLRNPWADMNNINNIDQRGRSWYFRTILVHSIQVINGAGKRKTVRNKQKISRPSDIECHVEMPVTTFVRSIFSSILNDNAGITILRRFARFSQSKYASMSSVGSMSRTAWPCLKQCCRSRYTCTF